MFRLTRCAFACLVAYAYVSGLITKNQAPAQQPTDPFNITWFSPGITGTTGITVSDGPLASPNGDHHPPVNNDIGFEFTGGGQKISGTVLSPAPTGGGGGVSPSMSMTAFSITPPDPPYDGGGAFGADMYIASPAGGTGELKAVDIQTVGTGPYRGRLTLNGYVYFPDPLGGVGLTLFNDAPYSWSVSVTVAHPSPGTPGVVAPFFMTTVTPVHYLSGTTQVINRLDYHVTLGRAAVYFPSSADLYSRPAVPESATFALLAVGLVPLLPTRWCHLRSGIHGHESVRRMRWR